MIQRSIALFLLTLFAIFTNVSAGSLSNDPFVQSNTNRSNFEPGGQYDLFSFSTRGRTTDRTGEINLLPIYDQMLGNLRLENVLILGDISYNTRFGGHTHEEHGPFSNSSSNSKSSEEGSIVDGFTVLKLSWSGKKVHPADAYDGEQGSGYPMPTGARDEYRYVINGNAQRISLQLDDTRSTSQRFLDRFSKAGQDFVNAANKNNGKITNHDPKLNSAGNFAQGFNGVVGAATSGFHAVSTLVGLGDALDGVTVLSGYATLVGISGLSTDGKASAIDALAAANGFKNDASDAIKDWAKKHPNSVEGIEAGVNGIGALVPIVRSTEKALPKTEIAKEPNTPSQPSYTFPDEVFTGKVPKQTEPGNTTRNQERYNPHTGKLEKSVITYDQYGRMEKRIDYTDHGYTNGKNRHSDPHTHYYEYSSKTPGGKETRVNTK